MYKVWRNQTNKRNVNNNLQNTYILSNKLDIMDSVRFIGQNKTEILRGKNYEGIFIGYNHSAVD